MYTTNSVAHTQLETASAHSSGWATDAVPNEGGSLCIFPLYHSTRLLASLSLLSSAQLRL